MNFCVKFISIIVCFKLVCLLKHVRSECSQPQNSILEFLCPFNYTKIGVLEIAVNSKKEVEINCDHIPFLEADILPNITLNTINALQFSRCPFPENGFQSVINKFSTKKLIVLRYEFGQQSLSKNAFQGMQELEYLHLANNRLEKLEEELEDVFENTPKLIALDLQDNDIKSLKPNLFQNLTFLTDLDLSNNQIEYFPPGLFQSLKKLEFLALSRNKIRTLNDTTFDGLHSLISLDLSANEIEFISQYAFKNLTNLTKISLSSNYLISIPEDVFKTNRNMQSISLNYNSNFQLNEYMFSNFDYLEEVDLSNCDSKEIPEHIFENSLKLKHITLAGNNLKEVPKSLFQNLIYLEKIDLSGNRLENIDNIVTDLRNLKVLLVEDNVIKTIDKETFSGLINLEELNLASNKIGDIHPQALPNDDRLSIINFTKNSYSGGDGLFRNLIALVNVDLSDNLITQIEDLSLENKPQLKKLDLRGNLINNISLSSLQTISSVDIYLQFNNISIVNFQHVDDIEGNHTANIYLDHNPIQCDCKNYDLFKYFHGLFLKPMKMFKIDADLTCAAPTTLTEKLLTEVKLSAVNCPLDDLAEDEAGCPEECHCNWRPFDTSIVVDCANKNLTKLPNLVESELKWINYTDIEFNLCNNNLVSVNLTGLKNLTKLFLAHNALSEFSGLPKGLKVLTLDHNYLPTLSSTNLQNLKRLRHLVNLTLGSNPWVCTCDTAIFSNFVRQNIEMVDYKEIYCYNRTTRLVDLTDNDLCLNIIHILVPLISIFVIIIAAPSAFYYKYQQELKVWLFSKKMCLWWVSESDLNDERPFDAFISYSHKDEDFVAKILISELERCREDYQLCIAYRDWPIGAPIVTNIADSIASSKRTIFVLSKNSLESGWAIAEFQQAHAEAIVDKKARVIILIYGDVDIDKIEDSALKAYLRTNTYVKWGDQYFWRKLKYALPHRSEVLVV